MKTAYLGLALGLVVAAAVLYYTGSATTQDRRGETSPSAQAPREVGKSEPRSAETAKPNVPATLPAAPPRTESSAASTPANESTEEILFRLQQASFTYDAAALRDIKPYLTSSDPAVRRAALDAVVTLGDAAGAAVLREAAQKTRDASEAAELRAKADYLELPPASLLSPEKIRALRAAHQTQQQTGSPLRPAVVPRGSALTGRNEPAAQGGN